ncbi:MAG: hypothetical protein CM15mP58_12600 [Burkholderiaceae bacterium]|nr:MAG: hypothetical protein CM15mP58_12600 [Burkholderiaceae bacterium]
MIPEFALDNVSLIPGSNPMYGLNTLGGALSLLQVWSIASWESCSNFFGSFNRKKLMFLSAENLQTEMAGITFYLQVILMNLVGGIIPTEKSRISSEKPREILTLVVLVMAYFGDSDLLGTGFFPVQTTALKMMLEKFKKAVYMKLKEKQFTLTQIKRKMKLVL